MKTAIDVARAALDYIDALPSDVVARLPAMPGFDRDEAENILTYFSNPCSQQEREFYGRFTLAAQITQKIDQYAGGERFIIESQLERGELEDSDELYRLEPFPATERTYEG